MAGKWREDKAGEDGCGPQVQAGRFRGAGRGAAESPGRTERCSLQEDGAGWGAEHRRDARAVQGAEPRQLGGHAAHLTGRPLEAGAGWGVLRGPGAPLGCCQAPLRAETVGTGWRGSSGSGKE